MVILVKNLFLILNLLATANGVFIPFTPGDLYEVHGDHVQDNTTRDSKPGTPIVAKWAIPGREALFDNLEEWRGKLGERLVKAASASYAMKKCGSFVSFGDYTWCKKAMPRESSPEFKKGFMGIHDYVVNTKNQRTKDISPEGFVGLSYGIMTSDLWSELMSNMYFVKTKLFDCYFNGSTGPMANDFHNNHSKQNPCISRSCYSVEYEVNKVCIDDSTGGSELFTAKNDRQYEPFRRQLKSRKPLSTFIKMDVEGSEWQSLEWLLENKKEMDKIRTLDMEMHFNKKVTPDGHTKVTQESMTKNVQIIERLAEHFAVTGSTIEVLLRNSVRNMEIKREANMKYAPERPAELYTPDGLSLEQVCMSFVNRKLLG